MRQRGHSSKFGEAGEFLCPPAFLCGLSGVSPQKRWWVPVEGMVPAPGFTAEPNGSTPEPGDCRCQSQAWKHGCHQGCLSPLSGQGCWSLETDVTAGWETHDVGPRAACLPALCAPRQPWLTLPQEVVEPPRQLCAVCGIPLPIFLHLLSWPAPGSLHGLPVGCLPALLTLPHGCCAPASLRSVTSLVLHPHPGTVLLHLLGCCWDRGR